MSSKKTYYNPKDSVSSEAHSKKPDDELFEDKLRIIQDNLVFVNGLPSDCSSKDLLDQSTHFGRYGKIMKSIINPPHANKKGVNYQAYVTYGNVLDASLAIVALDGYKLSGRPLKVSYGTTKYCSNFLKGNECPNSQCFYLHKTDKKKEINSCDTRYIFKEQNDRAVEVVCERLHEVVGRIIDDTENPDEGFPSLGEIVDFLIDSEILTQKQVDSAFAEVKKQRKNKEGPPKLEKVVSLMEERKDLLAPNPKLIKSNSYSTMCTPIKDSKINQIEQKQDSNKKSKLIDTTISKQHKQIQNTPQTQAQTPQTTPKKIEFISIQKPIQIPKQIPLQTKIERLILKQLLKSNPNDCKSRFIKNITANRQECSKMRSIVQKYLVAGV